MYRKCKKKGDFCKNRPKNNVLCLSNALFLRLSSSLHLWGHFKVHLENHVTMWGSPGGQKGANLGHFGPVFTFLGNCDPISSKGGGSHHLPHPLWKVPLKRQKTVEKEIQKRIPFGLF